MLKNAGCSHFLQTERRANLQYMRPINIFSRISAIPQPRSNKDMYFDPLCWQPTLLAIFFFAIDYQSKIKNCKTMFENWTSFYSNHTWDFFLLQEKSTENVSRCRPPEIFSHLIFISRVLNFLWPHAKKLAMVYLYVQSFQCSIQNKELQLYIF